MLFVGAIKPGLAILFAALLLTSPLGAEDDFASRRAEMVREVSALAGTLRAETGRTKLDEKVLAAMGSVARHKFVPPEEAGHAYKNRPLPIGYGQTISQPYIVALMTDLMQVNPDDRVLELGTGSGYQAAILAGLAREVYTIEIIEPLGEQAARRLKSLGYDNVTTRIGDGYYGWEQHAPFDAIIVTAAASHIPPPLIKQLKPGGRMVIPVGTAFLTQHLLLVEKNPDGSIGTRQILPVRFVPLTGAH
jgi:protein-L-isoaspartate(D-aspartate) O-methyltransferase